MIFEYGRCPICDCPVKTVEGATHTCEIDVEKLLTEVSRSEELAKELINAYHKARNGGDKWEAGR